MAISGLSVEGALKSASDTAKGLVNQDNPGMFSRVASRVVDAASSRAQSRIISAVGGRENLSIVEQVINGDIGGAVNAAVTRVIGGEMDIADVGGVIAGKVRESDSSGRGTLLQWGKLSPYLQAHIFPCDYKGNVLTSDPVVSVLPVVVPATEVNFDMSLNWQSPFENAGPESKAPALMAMIQSGQLATVANALQQVVPKDATGTQALLESAKTAANDLQGRTGITKLNSRQVFSGMPPVKVTMILHFRAVADAEAEVMTPYQRLLEWSVPRKLAENGVFTQLLTTSNGFISSLFPSEAPTLIGFRYGNNRYIPMVIESIGNPLDGPMDANGVPIYRAVQLTLATLTALEKNDVAKIFTR